MSDVVYFNGIHFYTVCLFGTSYSKRSKLWVFLNFEDQVGEISLAGIFGLVPHREAINAGDSDNHDDAMIYFD